MGAPRLLALAAAATLARGGAGQFFAGHGSQCGPRQILPPGATSCVDCPSVGGQVQFSDQFHTQCVSPPPPPTGTHDASCSDTRPDCLEGVGTGAISCSDEGQLRQCPLTCGREVRLGHCTSDPCGGGAELTDSGEVEFDGVGRVLPSNNLDANRYDILLRCHWLLTCSDETLVPRVSFTSFATENEHDFVNFFDGPSNLDERLASLDGARVPSPVTAAHSSTALLEFTSDGSADRWSAGDHFVATFDCVPPTEARVAVRPPRCKFEYVEGQMTMQEAEGECGQRHEVKIPPLRCYLLLHFHHFDATFFEQGGHLASILSSDDQDRVEAIIQAAVRTTPRARLRVQTMTPRRAVGGSDCLDWPE